MPSDQVSSEYSLSPVFCHSLMSSVKTKQLRVVENSTAQILSGKRQKGQKSLVNLEENRLLSLPPQFHSLSVCFSTDFSASWVPGDPHGAPHCSGSCSCVKRGKCSLCELFFTLVWVQNGSCTPTLCVTAQRPAKLKSKSASRETKATIS